MFTGLLQPTHLIILLAVALIFLGPKRLPDAARALGQGLREFKASVSQDALPEAAATTHEETHPVQHDDTAPVRHQETPPVP
jgi:sec-independent protein translocase protein TatA